MPEPLTHEWRLDHAKAGDLCLLQVEGKTVDFAVVQAWAALAQAHYAAANIRERPKAADHA